MLIFGLKHIHRFFRACCLLTQLNETAHVEFSRSMFSIKVSYFSPHFVAALGFKRSFFFYYINSDTQLCTRRIPLKKFCHYLTNGLTCFSMLFTLVYNNPPRAVLAFRNSCKYIAHFLTKLKSFSL